jgi:hypothetical protein
MVSMAGPIGAERRSRLRDGTRTRDLSARRARTVLTDWGTRLAGPTGLEPATSGVTGRRSSQLNYDPVTCSLSAPPVQTRGGTRALSAHLARTVLAN